MFRMFGLIGRADDLVESAWQARKWTTFVYLWLTCSVGVMILSGLIVFIPGIVYLEVSRVYHYLRASGDTIAGMSISTYIFVQYSALLNFAAAFAALSGLITLISVVPAMIVKEISGFKSG